MYLARQKNIGFDHLNTNFGRGDGAIDPCFINHVHFFSAHLQKRAKRYKRVERGNAPPNSLNYSNEYSRVNITGIVQRGSHPSGQLEARIS